MKALVTGAGGFIASYLLPYLQSKQIEVEALTSKILPGIRCHTANWKETRTLCTLLEAVKPDFIFHLAGTRASERLSQLIPVNVLYASNLFEAMLETGVLPPTLVVGSATEYGRASTTTLPITENLTAHPVTPYGISKYLQSVIAQFVADRGVHVIVARTFNLIGWGMPNTLVLGRFMDQLVARAHGKDGPIQMGNTQSVRDFVDVQDCVEIFWRLIQSPQAIGQIINICSGRPTDVYELLSKLLTSINMEVDIQSRGGAESDQSYGSNAKLLQTIGDFTFRSLEDSLQAIAGQLINRLTTKPAANKY